MDNHGLHFMGAKYDTILHPQKRRAEEIIKAEEIKKRLQCFEIASNSA
jgi:hypothetical protein